MGSGGVGWEVVGVRVGRLEHKYVEILASCVYRRLQSDAEPEGFAVDSRLVHLGQVKNKLDAFWLYLHP